MFNLYILPLLLYGLPFCLPRFHKEKCKLAKFLNYYSKLVFIKCKLPKSDSCSRLSTLKLSDIDTIYLRSTISYMHKIVHAHVRKPPSFPDFSHNVTRGHSLKLLHVHCKNEFRRSICFYQMVGLWNSLPGVCLIKIRRLNFKMT